MRNVSALFAAASFFTLAWAVDPADHPKYMKEINANMKVLKATMETKDTSVAAPTALKLSIAFDKTKEYWVERKIEDGIKWSDEALAGAQLVTDGAGTNDWKKIGDGISKMGGTCKSCHDVHRERLPDGTYKFKN